MIWYVCRISASALDLFLSTRHEHLETHFHAIPFWNAECVTKRFVHNSAMSQRRVHVIRSNNIPPTEKQTDSHAVFVGIASNTVAASFLQNGLGLGLASACSTGAVVYHTGWIWWVCGRGLLLSLGSVDIANLCWCFATEPELVRVWVEPADFLPR